MVSNPSSFAYLDGRRWLPSNATGPVPAGVARHLGTPPFGPDQDNCSSYNSWHFGTAADLVPYCTDVASATANYALRDVWYVQGGNDTCNEYFIQGCESHGLETTCMDMYEGAYRRERGAQYSRYLEGLYGKPTHRLVWVDDVGHDHSLIWQSAAGLRAIFGAA